MHALFWRDAHMEVQPARVGGRFGIKQVPDGHDIGVVHHATQLAAAQGELLQQVIYLAVGRGGNLHRTHQPVAHIFPTRKVGGGVLVVMAGIAQQQASHVVKRAEPRAHRLREEQLLL